MTPVWFLSRVHRSGSCDVETFPKVGCFETVLERCSLCAKDRGEHPREMIFRIAAGLAVRITLGTYSVETLLTLTPLKQVMPDLGRCTRESGEAHLAAWRVSPSHVTFGMGTFFVYFLRPSSNVKPKRYHPETQPYYRD